MASDSLIGFCEIKRKPDSNKKSCMQLARFMLYAVSEIHVWFLQMLQERNLNTK